MIRLKHITILTTFGALAFVGACGDDGSTTLPGAGGSAGSATAGSGGKATAGSGGKATGGSGGSKASGGASSGGTDQGGSDAGGSDAGGADSGGAGGAGPEVVMCPTDAVEFTAAAARAICLKQQECCSGGQTLEDCVTATKADLDLVYEGIEDSVTNERSELSCANFDTCVAAINSSDCSAWPHSNGMEGGLFVDNAACRVMMVPKLEPAAACTASFECIDGYCSETCEAFTALDAPCASGLCDPIENYCFDNGTEATDDDACKPRIENGETCSDGLDCQSGFCDVEGTGTCVAPAECVWTAPEVATSCSIGFAGRSTPVGPAGVGLLLGIAAMAVRRRRSQREHG